MVATNLHPDEWIRVRPLFNNTDGSTSGYETVAGDRSIGTRDVDIADDFVSAAFIGGVPFPSCQLIFGTAGGTFSNNNSGSNTTERTVGVLQCINGGAAGNFIFGSHSGLLVCGYSRVRLFWRIDLQALATAGEDYDVSFGFSDNFFAGAVNPTTHGCLFRYSRATDGNFWACVTTIGGVAVKTVTTTAPTPGTYQVLEIDIATDGSFVRYYIDNATVAAHYQGSSLAAAVAGPFGAGTCIRKTAGAAARSSFLDFFRLLIEQDTER